MQREKLQTITALTDRMLHQPNVFESIVADLSITVTEMFRDPEFFRSFRTHVIPLLRELPFIRIWHAGCATGQEVYSMAILLYEEGLYHRSRIYATDMNDGVLKMARAGQFLLKHMKQYTNNYVQSGGNREFSEYYSASASEIQFHSFLKERIVFAQHNLVSDSSINEFHVIICRNVLIYFNKDLQSKVHQLFYESLSPEGFLGLGSKEGMGIMTYTDRYREIDPEMRIYQKIT